MDVHLRSKPFDRARSSKILEGALLMMSFKLSPKSFDLSQRLSNIAPTIFSEGKHKKTH